MRCCPTSRSSLGSTENFCLVLVRLWHTPSTLGAKVFLWMCPLTLSGQCCWAFLAKGGQDRRTWYSQCFVGHLSIYVIMPLPASMQLLSLVYLVCSYLVTLFHCQHHCGHFWNTSMLFSSICLRPAKIVVILCYAKFAAWDVILKAPSLLKLKNVTLQIISTEWCQNHRFDWANIFWGGLDRLEWNRVQYNSWKISPPHFFLPNKISHSICTTHHASLQYLYITPRAWLDNALDNMETFAS